MKKFLSIFVIVSLIFLNGCLDNEKEVHKTIIKDSDVSLIEVDGCQHLLYHAQAGRSITHHENCSNPRHLL